MAQEGEGHSGDGVGTLQHISHSAAVISKLSAYTVTQECGGRWVKVWLVQ